MAFATAAAYSVQHQNFLGQQRNRLHSDDNGRDFEISTVCTAAQHFRNVRRIFHSQTFALRQTLATHRSHRNGLTKHRPCPLGSRHPPRRLRNRKTRPRIRNAHFLHRRGVFADSLGGKGEGDIEVKIED